MKTFETLYVRYRCRPLENIFPGREKNIAGVISVVQVAETGEATRRKVEIFTVFLFNFLRSLCTNSRGY